MSIGARGPPDAVLTLAEPFDKREIARARGRSASILLPPVDLGLQAFRSE